MERAFAFLGRNKWLAEIGAVLTGLWAASVINPWLGVLGVALGILSIIVSRFGTQWTYLSDGQKAAVVPGLVIGYVGLGLFIIVIALMITALKEEASRP